MKYDYDKILETLEGVKTHAEESFDYDTKEQIEGAIEIVKTRKKNTEYARTQVANWRASSGRHGDENYQLKKKEERKEKKEC